MLRQGTKQIEDWLPNQLLRFDPFSQHAIHCSRDLARQPQQSQARGRLGPKFIAQNIGKFQPSSDRIGRRGNVAGAQRVEKTPKRFIQIEIADRHHPGH